MCNYDQLRALSVVGVAVSVTSISMTRVAMTLFLTERNCKFKIVSHVTVIIDWAWIGNSVY